MSTTETTVHLRETEQSWEMTPEAAERNAKFAAFATSESAKITSSAPDYDASAVLQGIDEIGPEV